MAIAKTVFALNVVVHSTRKLNKQPLSVQLAKTMIMAEEMSVRTIAIPANEKVKIVNVLTRRKTDANNNN
jgi:hypothetical protein